MVDVEGDEALVAVRVDAGATVVPQGFGSPGPKTCKLEDTGGMEFILGGAVLVEAVVPYVFYEVV